MLKVYGMEQKDEWDTIVKSFKQYDTYYLNGYIRAFELHGDGEPLLFYYESCNLRAINVVMKRDIEHDKNFIGKLQEGTLYDFATPYGYGGWLVEGEEDVKGLSETYNEWCQRNSIVSEFVRFHPLLKNHLACEDFYEVVQLGEVVHMDITSPETIWNNLTSKNRNHIKNAIKKGVKIYNGRYPEIFEIFRTIYNSTMDKDNAEQYYYFNESFYKSVLEDLPQNAQVFFAVKDDIVIAASIMLAANGYMNYHLSGSLKEYSSLAPINLLLYEAALWGCANGYKTLYLGGGVGSGEDNLLKFKKAFYKGELNRFYIGKKIFDYDAYNYLLNLRGDNIIMNKGYFPIYRG